MWLQSKRRIRDSEHGFTALELIIVLIVGFSIIALSASKMGELFSSASTTEATNSILSLYSSAIALRRNTGYSSDILEDMVTTDTLPKNLGVGADNKPVNEWGQPITFTTHATGVGFDMSYPGVPKANCIKLVQALAASGNFTEILVRPVETIRRQEMRLSFLSEDKKSNESRIMLFWIVLFTICIGSMEWGAYLQEQRQLLVQREQAGYVRYIDLFIAAAEAYVLKEPEATGWIAGDQLTFSSGLSLLSFYADTVKLYIDGSDALQGAAPHYRRYVVLQAPAAGMADALASHYRVPLAPVNELVAANSSLMYRYVGWVKQGKLSLIFPWNNLAIGSVAYTYDVTVPQAIPEGSLVILCN